MKNTGIFLALDGIEIFEINVDDNIVALFENGHSIKIGIGDFILEMVGVI